MGYSTKEKRAEYDRNRDKTAKNLRDRRWKKARIEAGGCPNCGRMKEPELDGDGYHCSDCLEYHALRRRRGW